MHKLLSLLRLLVLHHLGSNLFCKMRPFPLLLAFRSVLRRSWCYCQLLSPLLLLYFRELLRAGVRWPAGARRPFWWSAGSSGRSTWSIWRPSRWTSPAIRWPARPSRWTFALLISLQCKSLYVTTNGQTCITKCLMSNSCCCETRNCHSTSLPVHIPHLLVQYI